MARNGVRDAAYVLHFLVALALSVIPVLGFLQSSGLVSHGVIQGWGMILVLGFWIPALILMLAALVISFFVRPPDFALWCMSGLLLVFSAGIFLDLREKNTDFVLGIYVVSTLGLAIRWMVKAGAWPTNA